jgi:predicted SAM-dependent methyltransferase
MAKRKVKAEDVPANLVPMIVPLKLDLGCGGNKKEGFIGVDTLKLPGVDVVHDLGNHTWPWADDSVDEVNCSHMIEHLTWKERVFFFNELHRVMRKGAKAQIVLPHWNSNRYYGDPTHQAPFSEMAWLYMNKEWRAGSKEKNLPAQAPHTDSEIAPGPLAYSCDFDVSYGYSLAPWCIGRDQGFVQFALQSYKEAAQDMIATAIKK